jgi:hypothetical protein
MIHAHGFSLSSSLKEACIREIKNRLIPLIRSQLNARWSLYKDGHDWIAFLSWHERRQLQGNVRIRSDDMYKSIALAGKLAADQMSEKHHMNEAKQRRRGKSNRPQVEVSELRKTI